MTKRNKKNYKIGLTQFSVSESIDSNMKKAAMWVKQAVKEGAEIVCLPELYRSQYFCQKEDVAYFDMAEPLDGPSAKLFRKIANDLGVVIILPIFEKRASGLYHNSVIVIENDGSVLGLYRKMHIPDDPSYYEKFYFTPGDLGYKSFNASVGTIGSLICWDQWYPEAARLTALQGASTIFYPTAIGWHPYEKEEFGSKQLDAWMTVQRGHAVANGVYVASVNRVGFEKKPDGDGGIEFWGSSFIAGPQGELLCRASNDNEEILIAEIDLEYLEDVRRNWPFFRDRRIESYNNITSRFIDE